MDANWNLLGSCQGAIYIITTEYEPFQNIMYKSIMSFSLYRSSIQEIYYETLRLLVLQYIWNGAYLLILYPE
jgi:hypothetical protein